MATHETQGLIGKSGMGVSTARAASIGGGVLDGGLEYYFRRQENPDESVLTSAAWAAGTAAAWYFAPHVMWMKTGAEMAMMVGSVKREGGKAYNDMIQSRGASNFGGSFQDTQLGATMRQRGMQAIQQSRLNARSALGGEARSLHRF